MSSDRHRGFLRKTTLRTVKEMLSEENETTQLAAAYLFVAWALGSTSPAECSYALDVPEVKLWEFRDRAEACKLFLPGRIAPSTISRWHGPSDSFAMAVDAYVLTGQLFFDPQTRLYSTHKPS